MPTKKSSPDYHAFMARVFAGEKVLTTQAEFAAVLAAVEADEELGPEVATELRQRERTGDIVCEDR